MKLILLSIFTLLMAQNSLASMSCMTAAPKKVIGVEGETVFNVNGCDQEAIGEDIRDYMLQVSGYEFEWYQDGPSSFKNVYQLLKTDHSDGDGSGPMNQEDLSKVVDFYLSDAASEDVMRAEFADSYMSGTGITEMVYFFNADKTLLIMIEKFVYAE